MNVDSSVKKSSFRETNRLTINSGYVFTIQQFFTASQPGHTMGSVCNWCRLRLKHFSRRSLWIILITKTDECPFLWRSDGSKNVYKVKNLESNYLHVSSYVEQKHLYTIYINSPKFLHYIPWSHRCRTTVHSSSFVRDLGVILDSELQMKRHVNKVASTCYYHLRWLFQLRGCVRKNVMLHLVTSLILTRIDSCNSVLINLPVSTVAPLQHVQNTAARLVLGLDRRAHITPAVKQLHWLPVRQRITFKVATLMHSVFYQNCPPYLRDLVPVSYTHLTLPTIYSV